MLVNFRESSTTKSSVQCNNPKLGSKSRCAVCSKMHKHCSWSTDFAVCITGITFAGNKQQEGERERKKK